MRPTCFYGCHLARSPVRFRDRSRSQREADTIEDLAAIIELGLAALQRRDWSAAYPLLRQAARETALDSALLDELADAALLLSGTGPSLVFGANGVVATQTGRDVG